MLLHYTGSTYGLSEIRAAGRLLARPIFYHNLPSEEQERILQAFRIAHDFRNSHARPMKSVRAALRARLRSLQLTGDTAARIKRLSSIRQKMMDAGLHLDKIQDLGGCRVILDDMAAVSHLIDEIRDSFPHPITKENPYIDLPKPDGYRSHHFVFQYKHKDHIWNGQKIELQIRTRLQHAWATAVEAIGLYRNEDLKHGNGDPRWLELFSLVSAEFASAEGAPIIEQHSDAASRCERIEQLNNDLDAVGVLENVKNATLFAENYIFDRGNYFLIIYKSDRSVEVRSVFSFNEGADILGSIERNIELRNTAEKVVLVQVDSVDRLIETYPNYFGDVSLFVENVKRICVGKLAYQYAMAPQAIVRPGPRERPRPDLLRRTYTRWTEK